MNLHLLAEIGQKALITQNGKVLMCRGAGEGDFWDFPGGRLNEEENPQEGLLREIKEELGLEGVLVGSPIFTSVRSFEKRPPRFFVVYVCTLPTEDTVFKLQEEEIAEVRWISESDVENLKTPPEWKEVLREYFIK